MRLSLTKLRLEIKKQFPDKYTDAELKKITGKNKEQVIDQYFKAELPEEEEEEEEEEGDPHQDPYENYYSQDDSAFAYVNPRLDRFDSHVPSTFSHAFPSDTTPQNYPPKRHSLQTPIYEEDLPDVGESDSEEDDDDDDDDESRSVKKAIKNVKSKISDLKAFSAPKGQSSQIPLSSDFASFGAQEAFSEPDFNDDSDYTKSFLSVLEDDEQQLKMIRAQQKRKKSKIPKLAKMPSIADQKEDKKDNGNNNNDDLNDFFASALES